MMPKVHCKKLLSNAKKIQTIVISFKFSYKINQLVMLKFIKINFLALTF